MIYTIKCSEEQTAQKKSKIKFDPADLVVLLEEVDKNILESQQKTLEYHQEKKQNNRWFLKYILDITILN